MTKLETIELDWRDFLEEEGFHAKREWGQGELDCTEPEFIQYTKEFWNQLTPDEQAVVLKDDNLNEKLNDLVPLSQEDKNNGTLITIVEAESNGFMNYDGYGYLCKEIDGKMYKSFISPDMDYVLPKLYKDNFTHMLWFNR